MMENLLASKVKIKILRFFFEFPLVKRNVREAAKECKIGFGVASNTLKELEEVGIIKMEKSGREIIYSLNNTSKFFEPLKRVFEIEKEQLANLPYLHRNLIADIIAKTKKLAETCFLFGSLVSGTFTTKSDVDLLFVSDREEDIRKRCLEIEDKYDLKLQVIVLRKEDIKKFKKSSLYKTIKKESLLLFGKGGIT
jgi:predicted nucleotidyltransferase